MRWTEDGLRVGGFDGFVRFDQTVGDVVPRAPGVYAVVRPEDTAPTFLDVSPAGHFKGRDPTVARPVPEAAWVPRAHVVYLGKASSAKDRHRGLRKRLAEYRRHGQGEPVGHWSGRYVWQLSDHADLLVGWQAVTDRDPAAAEAELIAEFVRTYGARPFANRKLR